MPLTLNDAIHLLLGEMTEEQLAAARNNVPWHLDLHQRAKALSEQSEVAELWNRTAIDDREKILLGVLDGPERKVSAFALAVKKFGEQPDSVRELLVKFVRKDPNAISPAADTARI